MALISWREAFDFIGGIAALEPKSLSFEQALGCRLASPLITRDQNPRFDNSMVDGYAVSEVLPSGTYRICDASPSFATGKLEPGQARPILTGQPVSPEIIAIAMQEDAQVDGSSVTIAAPHFRSGYIRRAGEDFIAGATFGTPGTIVDPGLVALATAAGLSDLRVTPWPKVSLVTTGSELSAASVPSPGAYSVRDSVMPALQAWCYQLGLEATALPCLPDDADVLKAAVSERTEDLIMISGGASVGDRDYTKAVAKELGFKPLFSGVAWRPGKPVSVHVHGSTRQIILSLPGNPLSSLVMFRVLGIPICARLAGYMPRWEFQNQVIAEDLPANDARASFTPAVEVGVDEITLGPNGGSHTLGGLVGAKWLAFQAPHANPIEKGASIPALPWNVHLLSEA